MDQTRTRRPAAPIGIIVAVFSSWLLACTPVQLRQNEPIVTPTRMQTPGLVPTFTATPLAATELATTVPSPAVQRVLLPTVTPTPASASSTFQPDQVQLALRTVVEGLDRPLFVTHANDGSGRLFIVEKGGTIRIWREDTLLPTPFLDLQDRVNTTGNEQGLLGLAFAPDYAASGSFFVNYTDQDGDTAISRFQVTTDPDRADPNSEFLVLGLDDPARNHNGGMLLFAPDGHLWIGMGDGGGAGDTYQNGQNPDTLFGKMLRLDVTSDPSQPYTIPPDNPWVDADWNGVDVRDEVWAVGLRNPWRYSFDRLTGDLWIGDVGQNAFEEINFTPAGSPGGLNYGWPLMEASACREESGCSTSGLELPVAEYEHSGHCSVTGGYVYRGVEFPVLDGVYFFGDYCSGVIWATWLNDNGQWSTAQVLESELSLSSFGEDEAGELLLTDLRGGTVSQLIVDE